MIFKKSHASIRDGFILFRYAGEFTARYQRPLRPYGPGSLGAYLEN